MSEHADLEAISAYIDGEAPEWADHVAGCAECRASADRLRAVVAAVGEPVEAPDPAVRELALTAALGDLDPRHPAQRSRFAERRAGGRWLMPAAAAVIAVVMGASVLLSMGTRSSDENTTLAGPAPESAPAGAPPSAVAGGRGAVALPQADLGDVPDAATLLARARPALAVTTGESAASARARSGAASDSSAINPGSAGPATATPSTALGQSSAGSSVVGTRPCEEQARAREPSLREVVYFATGRRGQVPAVVLGFATGPAGSPVTLLLLAQEGCGELLRAAGP